VGQLREPLFGFQRRGRRLWAGILSTCDQPLPEHSLVVATQRAKLGFGRGKLVDDLLQAIGWAGRRLTLGLRRGELIDAGGQFGSCRRQRRRWDDRRVRLFARPGRSAGLYERER
jgi:hypothetical protein